MAMAAGFDRPVFGNSGLLAEAGESVIFAKEGDDRAAFAPFTHQRGRDAGDVLGDAETLMAQLGQMFGRGARLGVADFRHAPDPVGQGDKPRLDDVDAAPDVTTIVHGPVHTLWMTKLERLAASSGAAKCGRDRPAHPEGNLSTLIFPLAGRFRTSIG